MRPLQMLKLVAWHSALYSLSLILSRGVSFILLPVFTRVLSPSEYGALDVVAILASIVNVTVALEISQGLARFYPEARTDEERRGLASTALIVTLGGYALFGVSAWATSDRLGVWLFGGPGGESLLLVASASICAEGVCYLAQNLLRFELRPRAYGLSAFVTAAVTVSVSLWLILAKGLGIQGAFWGRLAGFSAGAVVALFAGRARFGIRFHPALAREMAGFSLPLVVSSLGIVACTSVDRLLVKQLISLAELGIYAVAYRIAALIGLAFMGLEGGLTPLLLHRHGEPGTPVELARLFRMVWCMALSALLLLSLGGPELIALVAGPAYSRSATLLPLLVPAVAFGRLYIFAPGLTLSKKTWGLAALNIATAGFSTLLAIVLIPTWGGRGAATASLAGAGLSLVVLMVSSQRYYPVPHGWGGILGCAAGAAFLVGTGLWAAPGLGGREAVFRWCLALAGSAAISFVLLRSRAGSRPSRSVP